MGCAVILKPANFKSHIYKSKTDKCKCPFSAEHALKHPEPAPNYANKSRELINILKPRPPLSLLIFTFRCTSLSAQISIDRSNTDQDVQTRDTPFFFPNKALHPLVVRTIADFRRSHTLFTYTIHSTPDQRLRRVICRLYKDPSGLKYSVSKWCRAVQS
jgi:hypothetical protein